MERKQELEDRTTACTTGCTTAFRRAPADMERQQELEALIADSYGIIREWEHTV